jgi:hypothetical protein
VIGFIFRVGVVVYQVEDVEAQFRSRFSKKRLVRYELNMEKPENSPLSFFSDPLHFLSNPAEKEYYILYPSSTALEKSRNRTRIKEEKSRDYREMIKVQMELERKASLPNSPGLDNKLDSFFSNLGKRVDKKTSIIQTNLGEPQREQAFQAPIDSPERKNKETSDK